MTDQVTSAAARMEGVEAADDIGAAKLAKAKEDLQEGIKLLTRRQKLIKFADQSDSGWAAVEEYEDDELASNSEDERKTDKAERAAERKMAKKRKLKESKNREEVLKKGALQPSMEPATAFALAKVPMVLKPMGSMVPRTPGTCFHCGEPGHSRRECPKALASSVPYPLPNVSEHMAGESMCGRGEVIGTMTHSGGECEKELTPGIVAGEAEVGCGRCWEVQEGEAGTFSVRGRLCNCVEY